MLLNLQPITEKPKQERVIAAIAQAARAVGPGGKLPTVQELSRALNVSLVTLNQSLGKLEAKGYISRRQGSGIYVLPRALQQTIGLVFGTNIFSAAASYFYAPFLSCCERRATSHNENFSFYLDLNFDARGEVHHDLGEALAQRKLDGLLLIARSSTRQEAWLRAQGVPTVTFSMRSRSATVSIDYREMIGQAVRALAGRGCRRLALLGILDEHHAFFTEAMAAAGLPARPEWIVAPSSTELYPFHIDHHEAKGAEQAALLLERSRLLPPDERPDGWIVTDDMLTRGAVAVLERAGIAVGRDLHVATHANRGSEALRGLEDRLFLFEFDPEQSAQAMFTLLEQIMAGGPDTGVLIPPVLRAPSL